MTGCGDGLQLAEVTGVVQLDGRQLPQVAVWYLPDGLQGAKGPASSGVTDDQGRYRLALDDGRRGAVVGQHCVVLDDLLVYQADRSEKASADTPPPASRVPTAYSAANSTPLRQRVKPEPQVLDLHLVSSPH